MSQLIEIYENLMFLYGPQGWWPVLTHKGINPNKTGAIHGYHPGDYSFPRNFREEFEICLGAILTQNTSWLNVEKALINLDRINAIDPKAMLSMDIEKLKEAIRPAGYYNQKARKLFEFSRFYLSNNKPTREELLTVWGIGKETADSMLLYAYKVPVFVVDAYTKRIFSKLGLISENAGYDEIKDFFERAVKPDLIIYQEYHALIVEHAKRYYQKFDGSCPIYMKINSTV
jgi:endonuclease III related protein